MAFLKVKNRAISTLASGVSDVATEWTVATGEGALFPTTGDFHVTCEDEIAKCTSRTTDVLTVVREQEGTTKAAHASGKAVELRITAGVIENIESELITSAAITRYVDAGAGNDANPGTSASPKATMLGALNALPINIAHPATIAVRPGTYAELNTALEFSRFNTLDYITIKVVNDSDEDMFDNGKASAGGNDTLTDAGNGKDWTVNQFTDGGSAYIWIYSGTGAGQVRTIASNTATVITVTVAWTTNPDATSYYAIGGGALMSGTDLHHTWDKGKRVNVYGFRHTGATLADMRVDLAGIGDFKYNYCPSSVRGIFIAQQSISLAPLYNYINFSTAGFDISALSYVVARANVVTGGTNGFRLYYEALVAMSASAVNKNYIFACTTGIKIESGSGCVAANDQSFGAGGDANGADIDPGTSTTIPAWWN